MGEGESDAVGLGEALELCDGLGLPDGDGVAVTVPNTPLNEKTRDKFKSKKADSNQSAFVICFRTFSLDTIKISSPDKHSGRNRNFDCW